MTTEPEQPSPRFLVDCSGEIAKSLRQLQQQVAPRHKAAIAAAFRSVVRQLEQDAREVGEPFYRPLALRLQVRTCIVRPLVVDFAVHEERDWVIIKGVRLLSLDDS